MEEVIKAQHRSLDATDALASAWEDALAEGKPKHHLRDGRYQSDFHVDVYSSI